MRVQCVLLELDVFQSYTGGPFNDDGLKLSAHKPNTVSNYGLVEAHPSQDERSDDHLELNL